MAWVDYEVFTRGWLDRARRQHRQVDDGDRFISLWIAFNGWMKGRFGEDRSDRRLIRALMRLQDMKQVFDDLRSTDDRFAEDLRTLGACQVADMRHLGAVSMNQQYVGTYESLVETIYQIRCNLFHGRKDVDEDKKDIELVSLAYTILLPLFDGYLLRYGYR